ncbi:MAG: agmatine deiminase family protein [Bacteroidia bacterium]|nr:agmatine deiminase family protein [Bacteroidia bacterium]
MKYYLLSIVLIVCAMQLFAQEVEEQLPNYSTLKELNELPNYIRPVPKGITSPPVSPIRNAAEWEEMQAVLISWKTGYEAFLSEIIKYSREEAKVYIYCSDSNVVKNYLTSHSISTTNTAYIKTSMNSVWIRDFGPNNIYTNDVDSLYLVDWVYNRNRPLDDASPSLFATRLGLPIYQCTTAPTDLVATGGNFMSDGFGTAFSSHLILDENATITAYNSTPKTETDINNIVNDFLGINNYIKMETLPYDGIHHIDMHMKLLDEETLLIGQYPAGISDGPQIETNLNYILNNFNSVFGTAFKIIRIPMPPESSSSYPSSGGDYLTYTNSLIINKTVLVPTYYTQYDTTALRIYKEAMPGYRVVGINSNSIIPQSGTIHCTSHEIGAYNPLLISHQALQNTDNVWSNYQVNATIMHKTGILSALIYYRTDTTQPFLSTPMSLINASTNTWSGEIPVQASGSSVYYYIWAQAVSGKTQVRPMPAPLGWWKFSIYNPNNVQELNSDNFTLNIYSNNKDYNLVIKSSYKLDAKISLYSPDGKIIKEIYVGEWPEGTNEILFDCNNISQGLYIVNVETNRGNKVLKFIVK